jgi:hypothetical protein
MPAESANFWHEDCCLIEARGDSNGHFVPTTPALPGSQKRLTGLHGI